MSALVQASGLALRISTTARSPLRCRHCRPGPRLDPRHTDDRLRASDIVHFATVAKAKFGVAQERVTGGEPLVRPDIVHIVAMLARLGIGDLALTTNGQRPVELARPLRAAAADGRLRGCLGRRAHARVPGLRRAKAASADERLAAAMNVALGCKRGRGAFAMPLPRSRVGGWMKREWIS